MSKAKPTDLNMPSQKDGGSKGTSFLEQVLDIDPGTPSAMRAVAPLPRWRQPAAPEKLCYDPEWLALQKVGELLAAAVLIIVSRVSASHIETNVAELAFKIRAHTPPKSRLAAFACLHSPNLRGRSTMRILAAAWLLPGVEVGNGSVSEQGPGFRILAVHLSGTSPSLGTRRRQSC